MPSRPETILEKNLTWLGHAGFRIEAAKRTIYIDPYKAPEGPPADLILITHDHYDHFSPEDLQRIARRGTVVVAPATVAEHLKGLVVALQPGESYEQESIDVRAVAAYNTNKLNDEGRPFHPREAGWLGYVVTVGGFSIYHAGDTDVIPELDEAAGVDVALLPVSGTQVMTASEAVEAARRIDPGVAVPMHWGSLVGERADAERFVELASGPALILEAQRGDGEVIENGG